MDAPLYAGEQREQCRFFEFSEPGHDISCGCPTIMVQGYSVFILDQSGKANPSTLTRDMIIERLIGGHLDEVNKPWWDDGYRVRFYRSIEGADSHAYNFGHDDEDEQTNED